MIPLRHQRGPCGVARDALSTSRGGGLRAAKIRSMTIRRSPREQNYSDQTPLIFQKHGDIRA